MRQFNNSAEIRIGRDDLKDIIEQWLNERVSLGLGSSLNEHLVTDITLHPSNKYVCRVTIEPKHNKKSPS